MYEPASAIKMQILTLQCIFLLCCMHLKIFIKLIKKPKDTNVLCTQMDIADIVSSLRVKKLLFFCSLVQSVYCNVQFFFYISYSFNDQRIKMDLDKNVYQVISF